MKILVVGGRSRSGASNQPEWTQFDGGVIACVEVDRRSKKQVFSYVSPETVTAPEPERSVIFKSATLEEHLLFLCTQTEVLVLSYPDLAMQRYISLPCFNDLHHVCPRKNGNLLVVSTGLDMLFEIDANDRIVNEWATVKDSGWSRFDPHVDYRKIPTTKPHKSHPNFAFEIDNAIWVTRFVQKDALSLFDPQAKLQISDEAPHDGILFGERVYFTTVDGRVIIADVDMGKVVEEINLNDIEKANYPLGWCRGICVLEEHIVVVGFTRIRPTKYTKNIRWIRKMLRIPGDAAYKSSRIVQYDLRAMKRVWEIDLEDVGLNAVFSIHHVPEAEHETN